MRNYDKWTSDMKQPSKLVPIAMISSQPIYGADNGFVQRFWGFWKLYIFGNLIEPQVRKCTFPDFL